MVAPNDGWSTRGTPGAPQGRAGEAGPRQGADSDVLHAAAQSLARQVLDKHGHSADPAFAQVELLCDVLRIVRDIREVVQEVAQMVQKGVAGSGQEGVMEDVNTTLPQPDRAGLGESSWASPLGGPAGDSDGPGDVLTTAEVASLLRVNPKTISRWLATGEVPDPIAVKGVRRWRRSVIEAWLLEREGS